MKKILLSFIYCLACMASLHAQILFGTTPAGGKYDGGTIIKFVRETNELTVSKSFEQIPPSFRSFDNFIQASDGKFYGIARTGFYNGFTLFSFDPASSVYTRLKNFEESLGYLHAGLIQASDGKLYGSSTNEGTSNKGFIYSFDPGSSTYTVLKNFDGKEGSHPVGNLMQASDGKIYGTTTAGGDSDKGVIFSYDPLSSTYSKLIDFTGINGENPTGGLIQASDGKLYGMTSGGTGSIFSFDPASSTYKILKNFTSPGSPYEITGGLVQANNGKLYGALTAHTPFYQGFIFSFDPASSVYSEVHHLKDRERSELKLIKASDGKLYGTVRSSPENRYGYIFSLDPSNSNFSRLLNFEGTSTIFPRGLWLQAKDGKLYGIAEDEGENVEVIFSYDAYSSTFTKLRDNAANNTSGSKPTGSLVKASDKKLYGMTTYGGNMGYGVIFSFDPATSTYKKLKDFEASNGINPRGGLMLANNGKLYGMTSRGGSNNKGVIFSFDPRNLTYTKLKDFTGEDGDNPRGSLIQAGDGKLYGMTASGGGLLSYGVIFSFDPASFTYRKLKIFKEPCQDCDIGQAPYGNLLQANDGILYGMTSSGGSEGDGTVFSFDPVTFSHRNFINFNDRENPGGSLIQANDGKLYGMDYEGGGAGLGEIFSIDLPSRKLLNVASFDNDQTSGIRPLGTLIQARDGHLYGTTSEGGANQNGMIFSFDILTGKITRLKDFNGENGAFPGVGSSFIEVSAAEANTAPILTAIGNKSINELKKLSFTAKASDKDSPANTLKFSLTNAAKGKFPEGATINKSTGLFSWTPTEAQGPGTYRVKIVVSDGTCTDEEEIEIKVCEVNTAPVLNAIGNKKIDEGQFLIFTASATDCDLPANTPAFSLANPSTGNFPTGASINPATGVFSWSPSKNQVPGIYRIKIVVSDGSLTDEEEIEIQVTQSNLTSISLMAYPNPFGKHATVIIRTNVNEQKVILDVYDLKGSRVKRLYEGRADENQALKLEFDGSELSPGIYLLRLSTSKKMENFKIMMTE
jgi:uncharacterized repeat protein (TIGR03803 family)